MPLVTGITTVADMFLGVTAHYRGSKKDAYRRKVNGKYTGISYDELYRDVEAFALGLRALGLSHGDRIGVMSENRLEWIVADFACACAGLVNVPVFPILTPKQVEYIFNNAEVKGVIVSNALQLNKAMKIADTIPTLEHTIVMQPDALEREPAARERGARLFGAITEEGRALAEAVPGQLERLAAEIRPSDLLTLIYTSGTTGNPKGVMLSHGNFASNVTGAASAFPIDPTDVVLSYLPLCHAFERTTGYYTCFAAGATTAFADSIETVPENLLEVHPSVMTSVPRLFERIKNRVEKSVQAGPEKKRRIFHWAMRIGVKRFRRLQRGRMVGPILALRNAIADALVFSKVRERVGGNVKMFVSGGAALPNDIAEFFFALGLRIIEGYGLTESSPVISANPFERQKLGTVGKPLSNVEVRIAPDGEILTRGPHVMVGYYRDPVATAEAIDPEGWLHTGDIGIIDEDGYLKITDRKKHLFVSSGGKNIAPAPIENAILASRFVDQIMLIGDHRPFVTALIVPDFDALADVAGLQGITPPDLRTAEGRRAFLEMDTVQLAIEADIKRLQRDLSPFERVRRFELVAEAFTVDNGMLTPTLKVKRKVVEEKYAPLIDGMYEGVEMD
ncbi:MAG TPA: long-chain fatty acid--CoA ligase [Candidatus Kapabacteria bacterium]|nr:long-chain fatty acid--CoA ligase [Candidatus Kapabacteria bacterium]